MGNTQEEFNPWVSILFEPRRTIQEIIDTDPGQSYWLVVSLAGIMAVLSAWDVVSDSVDFKTMVVIAIVFGPFFGAFANEVVASATHWAGGWIDGKSSKIEMRAACAWASMPYIYFSFPRNILEMMLFKLGSLEILIDFWAIFIFLSCLSQVQGFSPLKAVGNMLLSLIPLAAVASLIYVGLEIL